MAPNQWLVAFLSTLEWAGEWTYHWITDNNQNNKAVNCTCDQSSICFMSCGTAWRLHVGSSIQVSGRKDKQTCKSSRKSTAPCWIELSSLLTVQAMRPGACPCRFRLPAAACGARRRSYLLIVFAVCLPDIMSYTCLRQPHHYRCLCVLNGFIS